jgi:hypothetical protein
MEKNLFVPRPKFEEMSEKISCLTITENGNCRTTTFGNKKFVITGAAGTGTGIGWAYLEGFEVTPEEVYTGSLVPMDYSKHWFDVEQGNRERSYAGMRIKADGIKVVFLGPRVRFNPVNTGEQIKLF